MISGAPLAYLLVALAAGSAVPARTGQGKELHLAGVRRLWVPPGTFTFGASEEEQAAALQLCKQELAGMERACSKELFTGEGPARTLFQAGFYLDRTEVTVGDYRRCADAARCDPRPLLDIDPRLRDERLPVTSATWFDAERYCRFAGGSLPTEVQWERAARGTNPHVFPWGDAPLTDRSNHGRFHLVNVGSPFANMLVRVDERDGWALVAPPGSFPMGASPDGFVDLAGNVMEWVADPVGDDGPHRGPAATRPAGASRRMLRGGSFRTPLIYQRTTAWESQPPDLRSPEVGFRCASDRP